MTKFTSGPWFIDERYRCLVRTKYFNIAECAPYGHLDVQLMLPEDCEGNALLISKAPEMYQALKQPVIQPYIGQVEAPAPLAEWLQEILDNCALSVADQNVLRATIQHLTKQELVLTQLEE